MNTKNPKYKEYKKLEREKEALELRYSKIIEEVLGPNTNYKGKPRNYSFRWSCAVDYTEVKSEIRVPRQFYYKPISLYLCPQDKDIIALDLLNHSTEYNYYFNKEYFVKDNLFNFEIPYDYYLSLPEHLKIYFRVDKSRVRNRLDSFKLVNRSRAKYVLNDLGEQELVYYEVIEKEFDYETVVVKRCFFNRKIQLKKASDKVVIQRYDVFSDITRAYNELEDKQEQVVNNCYGIVYNRSRRSWRKRHRKKAKHILKQNLNNCIKLDNFDKLMMKYYGPECDKWEFD